VVSDEEKASKRRQVGAGKTTTVGSIEITTDDIRTGVGNALWEKPGGCPLTGQVVSGVEVA
jgi:hypothetical protein